jgi:NAD(P)-dependent dehydrogenase (short-subunit alcohol dehydrogenase family)
MAAYYAPHRIRVNALAPGLVRTPMSARAQGDPEILQFVKHKQPLAGGMLEAGDVARAAWFLLSGESQQITGQILTVDGGWHLSA